MSHTPGPWAWGVGYRGLGTAHDEVLQWEAYEGMWLAYNDSREANARLIAAAPDLLASLSDLCDAINRSTALGCGPTNPYPLAEPLKYLDAARAAIAKAETP